MEYKTTLYSLLTPKYCQYILGYHISNVISSCTSKFFVVLMLSYDQKMCKCVLVDKKSLNCIAIVDIDDIVDNCCYCVGENKLYVAHSNKIDVKYPTLDEISSEILTFKNYFAIGIISTEFGLVVRLCSANNDLFPKHVLVCIDPNSLKVNKWCYLDAYLCCCERLGKTKFTFVPHCIVHGDHCKKNGHVQLYMYATDKSKIYEELPTNSPNEMSNSLCYQIKVAEYDIANATMIKVKTILLQYEGIRSTIPDNIVGANMGIAGGTIPNSYTNIKFAGITNDAIIIDEIDHEFTVIINDGKFNFHEDS